MKAALAFAATIALPIRAAAQTPEPPPAPAPAPAPTPATSPAPEDTSTGSEPAPDAAGAPAEAPPADPAYGERPDPSYREQHDPRYDTRDFPAPRGKDVVIVSYPDRSKRNILTLAILGGAGVVTGAIGAYFHLDARSAADEVAADGFTGEVWSAEHQDAYDRSQRSSVVAGVFYGIGGALLLATAITYIATEPKAETMVIHPRANPKTSALVAPTRGGAILGGTWSF